MLPDDFKKPLCPRAELKSRGPLELGLGLEGGWSVFLLVVYKTLVARVTGLYVLSRFKNQGYKYVERLLEAFFVEKYIWALVPSESMFLSVCDNTLFLTVIL